MLTWDAQALLWINQHHDRWLDYVLYPISLAGEKGLLLALLFVGLLWMPRRQWARWAVIAVALVMLDRLFFQSVTTAFYRERPFLAMDGVRQVGPLWYTSSFPSGHAHYAWLVTVLFAARRRWFLWLFIPFSLITCYARPYFGMHFPLDVVVGSLTGIAVGLAVVCCQRSWQRYLERQADGPAVIASGHPETAERR